MQSDAMVRRLGVSDVDAYVALRREMLTDAPWAFVSSPGEDRGSDPDKVRASMSEADFATFGAYAGGALVGAACVRREERMKRRHVAWVTGVYVTPTARGRGLSRAIVGSCVEHARGWAGVAVLQLSVSERSGAARRVYESLGFEAWGIEPDAIRLDPPGYDVAGAAEIHMRLAV